MTKAAGVLNIISGVSQPPPTSALRRRLNWRWGISGGSRMTEMYDTIQSRKMRRQNYDNISYYPQELA